MLERAEGGAEPDRPGEARSTGVSSFWGLEQTLVLMAGAGTGKTHSLVTLSLHLLGGARSGGEPVHPSKLCLLTFTEKAAGEMKERLRDRLVRLASVGTD